MKRLATIIFNIRSATIFCAVLLLLSSSAFPQATITQYSRATFSGTYTSITGSSGPSGDDAGKSVTLPFTFPYDGHNYDRIWICTNGWIELGSASSPLSSSNSAFNGNLFATSTPNKTLAPWWDDLATGSGAIQYTTLGSAPNRVFVIEWANVLSFFSGSRTISFQLRLYETLGVIEFWYGPATGVGNSNESASFGIKDSIGGPGHFIDGPTGSSTVGTVNLTTTGNWPSVFYRFSSQQIQVVQPNGGEFFNIGFTDTIKWSAVGPTNVKLEYSTDAGNSWSVIAASTSASTGSYAWAVPNTPTTQAKVRISDASNASVFDVSDGLFAIQEPPSITVAADSFAVTVGSGDSTTQTLTIGNTGPGILKWSITLSSGSTTTPSKLEAVAREMQRNAEKPTLVDANAILASAGTENKFLKENRTLITQWSKEYAATVAYAHNASPQAIDIALIASDNSSDVFDVQAKLLATGQFASISIIYASSVTPTLAELRTYKAVLVWGSLSFASNVTLGNNLADYVDAGGGVVTALWTAIPGYSYSISGRFDTQNYWAIVPGGYVYGTTHMLGTIYNPKHPIMRGVSSFNGGSSSYRYSASIVSGANRIADWDDGNPLIVERLINGHNRVDLGFFPPSSDVNSGNWLASTDGATIMANALTYVGGTVSFLSVAPDSGTVASHATQNVAVRFNAQDLTPGDYRANILINSNDPTNGTKNVRVHLTIPVPKIALQPDSLSRTISDNDSVALPFTISNTGAPGSKLLYKASVTSLSKVVTSTSLPSIIGTHVSSSSSSQTTSSTTGPRVLLVHTENSTLNVADVKNKIMSAGNFSTVDMFDARISTPTLTQLQSYDAVFVWSSGSYYDPVELGNVLADYVDRGGGVVSAMYNMGSYTPILGRFATQGYSAIQPAYTISGEATLGTIYVPSDPIMRGVTSFDGGSESIRPASALTSGATLIASWSDGMPLVAVKKMTRANRADLGFYPPSSDVGYGYWISSTDGAKLMANALNYVAGRARGQVNVTFSPDSGSVAAGGQQTIQMTLRTENAQPGAYILTVGVESNDPDSARLELPVHLTIQDLTPPHISIRFFQNEEFPQYIKIVSVAHESLYSSVFKVALGTDTSQLPAALIDTANFVYNVDYKLTRSGTLSAIISADDSLGNDTTVIRQIAVQNVSSTVPTTIVSTDMKARIEIPENSVAKETYIIAEIVDEPTVLNAERGIGPSYQFGPQSLTFTKPVKLSINIPSLPNGLDLLHVGIYSSNNGTLEYLPTQVDMKSHTLHAEVAKLGEFLLAYNPTIQSEIYQDVPHEYELKQNFPNPFNGGTVIQYALPVAGSVELTIYNVLGQQVTTLLKGYQPEGYHEVRWEGMTSQGTIVSSGMYFYQLNAGAKTLIRKMLFMK